jgi:hypothetical protein
VRFSYVAGDSRATNVPVAILHADGETTIAVNQKTAPPIDGRFVSLGEFRFERGNQGYVLISNEGTQGHVTADAVQFVPIAALAPGTSARGAVKPEKAATSGEFATLTEQVKEMEHELARLIAKGPIRPMVMSVREDGTCSDLPIHVRGSVHNLGQRVPRGYLTAIESPSTPPIPVGESGRRQLAQWLTDPTNPLTARVIVNRVWSWLFGAGLSPTTDNFGVTGEPPSHPELLDYLAIRFIDDGWSVKRLVRVLVLSRTYQLSAASDSVAQSIDAGNGWRWRRSRKRLEAEAIRDAMLCVSGRLSLDMGGARFPASLAADYGYQHEEPCRSVYVPIFRNALPEFFVAFDYPDPSMVSGRRNASIVTPQALFLMNHPFVAEQAEAAAKQLLAEAFVDDRARVEAIYRHALARTPTNAEVGAALGHLRESTASGGEVDNQQKAWARIVHAIFASPEFRYLE